MIVEFIGTPGAGKTTFMPVVSEYFRSRSSHPYSVIEAARPFAARTTIGKQVQLIPVEKLRRFLLWQIFYSYSYYYRPRFAARNQTLMQQIVLEYQAQRPITKKDKKHVLHWFLHLTGSFEFLKTYIQTGDVLMFDEGFVHRVVQLFASEIESPDLDSVKRYLDMIPCPDLIIYPKVSSNVCEKRVFKRGVWNRFQTKGREETIKFIQNAHKIVTYAVEYIKIKDWKVIEVDNNGENLAEAEAALKRTLSDSVIQVPGMVVLG